MNKIRLANTSNRYTPPQFSRTIYKNTKKQTYFKAIEFLKSKKDIKKLSVISLFVSVFFAGFTKKNINSHPNLKQNRYFRRINIAKTIYPHHWKYKSYLEGR